MNSLAPATLSASLLDDVIGLRRSSDGPSGGSHSTDHSPVAFAPRPRGRGRTLVALLGAGLAGLLAGIDVLLLVLLETLLRGVDADSLDVPGMGFAAWSAENGLAYGFGPAAIAILTTCTGVGVALGWMFVRSSRSKSADSSQA